MAFGLVFSTEAWTEGKRRAEDYRKGNRGATEETETARRGERIFTTEDTESTEKGGRGRGKSKDYPEVTEGAEDTEEERSRSLHPGAARGTYKPRYAARHARMRRGRKNRAAPPACPAYRRQAQAGSG